MKVRIKFAKYGTMKFIGHLDIMRYFQKAIRRAGLDIRFSEGMSPHMIMSFASPLGVGLTSKAEYMDIDLKTPMTTEEAVRRLNEAMVEGMEVLDMRQVEEGKAGKAMSLVAAADYLATFRAGKEPAQGWQDRIAAFLAQDQILVVKETKKGEKTVDIRPLIYDMRAEGEGIFLSLSSGSEANLKPEAVIDAFSAFAPFERQPFDCMFERLEVYADRGKNGKHKFVPLGELGTVITAADAAAN